MAKKAVPVAKKLTLKEKCKNYLQENPSATIEDVRAALNCSAGPVMAARKEMGLVNSSKATSSPSPAKASGGSVTELISQLATLRAFVAEHGSEEIREAIRLSKEFSSLIGDDDPEQAIKAIEDL